MVDLIAFATLAALAYFAAALARIIRMAMGGETYVHVATGAPQIEIGDELLSWYGRWLNRLAHVAPWLAKPLGLCDACFSAWLGVAVWAVYTAYSGPIVGLPLLAQAPIVAAMASAMRASFKRA